MSCTRQSELLSIHPSNWPTCDAVVGLGCVILHALLRAADGVGQQRVDARVLTELGWEACPAGRAGLLALAQPAFEAGQAEVVLAGALQEKAGERVRFQWLSSRAGVVGGVVLSCMCGCYV